MPVCPECRTEVTKSTKTWSMIERPIRKGEQFKLAIGIFSCPRCGINSASLSGERKRW